MYLYMSYMYESYTRVFHDNCPARSVREWMVRLETGCQQHNTPDIRPFEVRRTEHNQSNGTSWAESLHIDIGWGSVLLQW